MPVHDPVEPAQDHVLYTYQQVLDATAEGGSRADCHVYGPTTADAAQLTGSNMASSAMTAQEQPLAFMVLPLEPVPV